MKIPDRLRLESAAVCQLKCPSCSTGTGANVAGLGRGFLKADQFQQFIERNPEVRTIGLSNYGEIFLNPALPEILRIAHERGVKVNASNGVNLNTTKPEVLEAVVKYEMQHITVSIDGASQETYVQYRRGGDFDEVLKNLRLLVDFKKKHNSRFPELTWQFVVFGHNEHELPAAIQLAKELGMEFKPKLSWDEEFSPIRDAEFVRKHTGWPFMKRSDYEKDSGMPFLPTSCHQLWDFPVVNWNGRLLGCSVNSWGDFGANVFEVGFRAAYTNERIAYAREMLQGRKPPRIDVPCSVCPKYQFMRKHGKYISRRRSWFGMLIDRLRPKPAVHEA